MAVNTVTAQKSGFMYKVTPQSIAHHPVPKEQRILNEAIFNGFVASGSNILKAIHCHGKREAEHLAAEIDASVNDTATDGLIYTFADGTTYDVVRVLGILNRGKTLHNSLRFYIIVECEFGDGAFVASEVIERLF